MDFIWSCQHCSKRGDVVGYVIALEHLEYDICHLVERTGKERTLHLTRIPDEYSDDTLSPSINTVISVME